LRKERLRRCTRVEEKKKKKEKWEKGRLAWSRKRVDRKRQPKGVRKNGKKKGGHLTGEKIPSLRGRGEGQFSSLKNVLLKGGIPEKGLPWGKGFGKESILEGDFSKKGERKTIWRGKTFFL